MQNIIVERPYQFIRPLQWDWLPRFLLRIAHLHSLYNRFAEGVISHECRHIERLRESVRAGHGILIAPNHSRTADPPALGWLCEAVPCLVYGMASRHLFHQSWLSHWVCGQ
jgi:1-acyl-sn-glycerol-3-phosphate acyltransferase